MNAPESWWQGTPQTIVYLKRKPNYWEGMAGFGSAAFLFGRDAMCGPFIQHLFLPMATEALISVYFAYRFFWCLHKQVTE